MTESTSILSPLLGVFLLVIFGLFWVGLGIFWGRRARSLEGFMVAGRNVGLALGTATAAATWITSNTTMLAPQFALELGVWGMLAYSTAAFGLFLFAPLAKRIRQAMPNGYTSVEFMRLRFGKGAYIVFLLISLFYSLTWMVSMAMAGGILLEALAHIPYVWGMSAILLVCVLYTLFGGLYAVIGTDFIQSFIILVGLVAMAVTVLMSTSTHQIHANLVNNRPMLLDALFPAAIMAIFNNMLFGIGEIFHSNVWWSRAFAMREGVGGKAYVLAGLIWLPIPIVAGFLGLAAPSLDINVPRADVAGPMVAAQLLGYGGAVLVFIIVFCSLASSIDSLLAATSDVVTTEVIKPMFLRDADEPRLRKAAGFVILGIGALTWVVCLLNNATLAKVLFFAGPLVGSTIWPILTGLFWRRTSGWTAVAAMVLGSAAGLIAYKTIGWYTGALVGTGVSCVVTLLGTCLSSDRFEWRKLRADLVEHPQHTEPEFHEVMA